MDTKPVGKVERIFSGAVVVIVIIGVIWALTSIFSSAGHSLNTAKQPTYSELARARFDTILASSPELSGIACENNDCASSVVYFDYKKIPDDYDSVIRGNAATYSKFGLDNNAISHVSVAARFNGQVFYACNAADGVVKDCGKYHN
jgi:hypothetical protein